MNWKEEIIQAVASIEHDLIDWRRHLHQNPELSFQEYNTANFVEEKLKSWGIKDIRRVAETGIVGCIGNGEKTIALRADLDALPIKELNETEYVSKNEGVMHACGHDVHTTCLLGAIYVLKQWEGKLPNRVMFIFQPGEEKLPGGASLIIESGVFEEYKPSCIIGQHVYPEMQVGNLGFREGIYMASCDELFITVKGKGGHGARPHKNIDPILIGSHIVVALQQMVSRVGDPKVPTVVSIGEFLAHGATNVCPNEATMQGTIRTFDEEWRAELHEKIKQLCTGIAASMGGEAEVVIDKGYPFLHNEEELTKNVKSEAIDLLGEGRVSDLDIRMTAEDFSYYSQHMDACFYRLGVGNKERNITAGVHSPHFDIDEKALSIGVQMLAYAAVKLKR